MGTSHSHSIRVFSEEELETYKDLTYLSEHEIRHAFDVFASLNPHMTNAIVKDYHNIKLPKHTVLKLPQLRSNPFKDRILSVFSTSANQMMSFEDFLDMASVFSARAPKSIKIEFAFRVYDFNEDDYLCRDDIRNVVKLLCGENAEMWEERSLERIVDKFFKEADIDNDNRLDFSEFENMMSKAPDFEKSFCFKL